MFSDNIKKLREESGLTQDEFAEKIFVTRTAVSKWENGKSYPSIDSLVSDDEFQQFRGFSVCRFIYMENCAISRISHYHQTV